MKIIHHPDHRPYTGIVGNPFTDHVAAKFFGHLLVDDNGARIRRYFAIEIPALDKFNTQCSKIGIEALTQLWTRFAPHQPFRYTFLDERYAAMYIDVQRTGKIFTSFSILAIVVACLGLFALSAFMVEQRSKEISVRLVLGASVNRIFKMLTWNFIKLVLIAFLLAAPLGAMLMERWLEDYTYKTEISWDVFAITGIAAVVIALVTITYQSLRAAWIKPIVNLKNE